MRGKTTFNQLSNRYGVKTVWQVEMQTTDNFTTQQRAM
jgi:hypothetical protein